MDFVKKCELSPEAESYLRLFEILKSCPGPKAGNNFFARLGVAVWNVLKVVTLGSGQPRGNCALTPLPVPAVCTPQRLNFPLGSCCLAQNRPLDLSVTGERMPGSWPISPLSYEAGPEADSLETCVLVLTVIEFTMGNLNHLGLWLGRHNEATLWHVTRQLSKKWVN